MKPLFPIWLPIVFTLRRSLIVMASTIFACLLAGLILSSCQTEVQPTVGSAPAVTAVYAPTEIVLLQPSPLPSATMLPTPTQTATPDPGADDLDEYYGGLVVTLDNVGETLVMRTRGGFLLRLGEEFDWSVTVSPPDVITLNQKVILESGEQGVFIARKKGSAILRAVGEPVCRTYDPPCAMPQVLFQMSVLVE